MLMVKAGNPVDEFIEHSAAPGAGDLTIDGGNSHFPIPFAAPSNLKAGPVVRRTKKRRLGREEGRAFGPSMMPGGSPAAWPR